MEQSLTQLYEGFRGIRTLCTGIMGYLALLHEGEFEGADRPIIDDLAKATAGLVTRLDALRDLAARAPHGANSAVDEAVAVILSGEPRLRISLEALTKRLGSTVAGLPKEHWLDDLGVAQVLVREVAAMNEALKTAHLAELSRSAEYPVQPSN